MNSVAAFDGLVAVAVDSGTVGVKGTVVFVDAATLAIKGATDAGFLPDMVTFTPNGKYVLVANEGEPSDDYLTDPVGSISIIEVGDGTDPTATDIP